MASNQMSLKLLVDRKGPIVLFAEASKEFVDFLLHIFSLPLGTLIEVLGSNQMVGCLGKLKDSIQSFNENYLQPGIKLDEILNPKSISDGNSLLLSYDYSSSEDQSGASSIAVYRCDNPRGIGIYAPRNGTTQSCRSYVTLLADYKCPNCRGPMNVQMTVVTPPNEVAQTKEVDKRKQGGYVKEVVTYMVMDDLEVKPMSAISSITLINNFGVKDLNQLEEKTVSFGKEEVLVYL